MQNIECDQCGGTDFYKEAGFYYCSGCQIQSQEVQEYVFEEYEGERPKAPSKKIRGDKSDKTENKITSWECYNYILLGLTEELIGLGAHKNLKAVVKNLWMIYLEKLQVFKRGHDELPKLQAVNSGVDAEIVYGKLARKKRKRHKSSSDETNVTSLDSSSMKRERTKKKRALAQAHYEDYTQKSQGTSSLHNETLTSLQTGSEKSSKHTIPISYNIYALKELKRKQSKYHLKKHRLDFNRSLICHKSSYRKISHKYRNSPYILSLNKLYAILYLGLLILKDKIQLSDMFRFIKEGHLSFNCYSHLLPDDFSDKILNFRNFKKACLFASASFRIISSEMARTGVTMSFRKRGSKVPNYEGRVLSIILFVVKLLFGLDDVTEFHLANYAHILNQSAAVKPKMFSVVKWLKYIEYRNLVLSNNHFPTSFDSDDIKNVDLALGFIGRKKYPEKPQTKEFPVTLTPFLDYTNELPKENFLSILSEDYTNDSLIHMLRPNQFLKVVNKGVNPEIVNGGANEDWNIEKVKCSEQDNKREMKERRKFVTVELTLDHESVNDASPEETQVDADIFKETFRIVNESIFRRNSKRLEERLSSITDLNLKKIYKDIHSLEEDYSKHYNPYERFWLRSQMRIETLSQQDCQKLFEKFPYNFRLLFKECQRIAQQTQQDLLVEYQLTELYLVYLANYKAEKTTRKVKDKTIAKFLERAVDF
ncbi:TATA box-binding protein-associated factor RNA polymerase I subunit B, partial [Asbolus verrucosus]